MNNIERHRKDLTALIEQGDTMRLDVGVRADPGGSSMLSADQKKTYEQSIEGCFERNYQAWITESAALLEQILPERKQEFYDLYLSNSKRKELNLLTYTIQDWMLGVRAGNNAYTGKKSFDDFTIVVMKFASQLAILKAAERKFESSLFEIKQLLRADLFDSELDAAAELLKLGFVRAAGAVSGVVLEKHLASVCDARGVKLKKSHPTISTFNDELKNSSAIDVPTWRFIQRLGDLRNLCDHGKGRDPSEEEVSELIEGVKKISKTVY